MITVMKQVILFFIVFYSVAGFAQGHQLKERTPVERHGQLSVRNGKIVDADGKAPQLRGISLSWSIWEGKKYYTPEVVRWLVADFKVSLLRVAMGVEPDGGYLQQPEAQERLVVAVTDEAIKQGIYVLLDWHDHHASKNAAMAKRFFEKISRRYAGKSNVIYEIWNEPEREEWKVVKDYALELIPVIRKNDRHNLIVVGSPHWDQDVDVVAKDPVTGYDEIAYSFHFYASDPHHQEKLMAKADVALKAGLPLIVTEWGVGEADGNGIFDREKVKTWFDWLEANRLSSVNWNLTDKNETTALLLPGANPEGRWPPDKLSPAGFYIREQLREYNDK